MSTTVKIAPDLYSKPPKSAPEGAQLDYRSIALATTDLVTTQLLALGILPAGHRLDIFGLESSDLDTNATPTITVSVGILNSNYGEAVDATPALESGMNILTDSTICQAGGRATPTLAFSKAIGIDETNDRIIALQFTNAPATGTSGTVGIITGTAAD
jgi:hypothetical protein